ncbi:hypothetical protein PMIN01_11222 [Paraphaeosphaeria minitans]|uniref:Uncharacterized protein n=1 Tax=Paraphaeosphaeria minitans TaxID=565426 RepID=A0A9P6G7W2_9PLEO|nr:hypothetical protein PMIN01_11222 [Paraphaeosphaeria minitans]
MGFLQAVKGPVHRVKCAYKSHDEQDLRFYPHPNPTKIFGKIALIPAHVNSSFGEGNVRLAQANSVRPIPVRAPSIQSKYAIFEDASESISTSNAGVEDRVEELNNFEIKRSNAVRRKPFATKPGACKPGAEVYESGRPLSYLLPIQFLASEAEFTFCKPQLKRARAVRHKINPKILKVREALDVDPLRSHPVLPSSP